MALAGSRSFVIRMVSGKEIRRQFIPDFAGKRWRVSRVGEESGVNAESDILIRTSHIERKL